MQILIQALKLIFKKNSYRYFFFGFVLFFFLLILLTEKMSTILTIFGLDLTLTQRLALILTYIIDIKSSFTTSSIILVLLGSILGGINLTFAFIYFKTRTKTILKSHLYSGTGLFFAFLGVGCAACGTALLSTLLGFLGLSSMLGVLPYQGLEVGYLGLAVLMLATMSLSKKVIAPNIC